MVKKQLIILFFLAISCLLYAQKDSLQINEGNRIIINSGNISDSSYYIYTPPFNAKGIYKNIKEIKNNYPEELMSSILSANTQEWVDYNTMGGSENSEKLSEHTFQINEFETTYFELLSKLEFKANNSKMAIIKFVLHKKDLKKPVLGVISMQNIDGEWKKITTPYLSKMSMVLLVFKSDVLGRLLEGKSNNEFEKKIAAIAYNKNGLDFNKLLQIKLNEQEKKELTNPLNW